MTSQVATQYQVEIFTEGDEEGALAKCWEKIRIINSMNHPWPIVNLYCKIDNQVIIEKDIYGKKDIVLTIWLTQEDGTRIDPPWTFTLLYLEANLDLSTKVDNNISDRRETQRRMVCFTCLCKPAVETMTQFVNYIYEEETGKTPIDIIKDLLDRKGLVDRIVEEDGKNEMTVPQLIVPPLTIKSAVDYIHEKFGVYQGPLFRFANYSGQFLMWDLKKKFDKQKDTGFAIYHKLPAYTQRLQLWDEIMNKCQLTDNNYCVYDNVKTLHYANSKILQYGWDNIYITHPHEDIAYFMKANADKIVTDLGMWLDNDKLKYHEDLKYRKLYYTDHKGFEVGSGYTGEYSDYSLQSRMADNLRDSTSMRFYIYRNIKLTYFMKVGEVLNMIPYSEHELFDGSDYSGGYIVTESIITFSRESSENLSNTHCEARITGHRTVQTKT